MEDINTNAIESHAQYEFCSYCGSRLNYSFYFCTVCATPYRPLSAVIQPYTPRPLSESELIKSKVPNVWVVFWSFAIVVFIVGLLNHLLFEKDDFKYAIILNSILIFLTTFVYEIVFWRSLVVQLKKTGFDTMAAWVGLLLLFIIIIINISYHSLILKIDNGLTENLMDKIDLRGWPLFILICLIPGFTEEIAFRGLIQHWLHTVLKPWRAIILTAALFTALHMSIVSAPILFLAGILFGWVKWKSRSLYPSILMHILYNWISISIFSIIT